jgi:hypothetical protein
MGPESGPEGARKQGCSQKNSGLVTHFRMRVCSARSRAYRKSKTDPAYGRFSTGGGGASPIT